MPIELKRAYLDEIRLRYKNSTKKEKGLILREFCEVCRYDRKYAIRILNRQVEPRTRRPGPQSKYQSAVPTLKEVWLLMGRICSKKMCAGMYLWLPHVDASAGVKQLLRQVSPSTIDRLLRAHRQPLAKGLSTTRGSWVKSKIPIQLLDAKVTEPGFIEADTVAHCGNSMAGEYVSSLTMTDLYSGWTENRAVLGKTAEGVLHQIQKIENAMPFDLRGFASDNGTEFMNELLHKYLTRRPKPINFVRRRPYKKNDAAHVEQKNWTHVRQLFGYQRFEKPELVIMMNEIYQAYWNPLWNYFTPVMKLMAKERVGGSIKKFYDEPRTPCQRLLDSAYTPVMTKGYLKEQLQYKNPVALKRAMDKKLKEFFDLVDVYQRDQKLMGT